MLRKAVNSFMQVTGYSLWEIEQENRQMMAQSGDSGDDPNKDPSEEKHLIDDDSDLEATRILPMRVASPPTPGAVIGQSGAADGDEEKTYFMPTGSQRETEPDFNPAVGWLVILEGPGKGNNCPIYYGQNTIGRGEDQRIRLNFGDARITRDTHAYFVYDDLVRKFYLRDNGKANLVRLNNVAVMAPMEVNDRDIISIGETTLLFVALCGSEFDWMEGDDGPNTGTGA